MKTDLPDSRLRRKIVKTASARIRILGSGLDPWDKVKRLRRLSNSLLRMSRSWILDGHTRYVLTEALAILKSDIDDLVQSPSDSPGDP